MIYKILFELMIYEWKVDRWRSLNVHARLIVASFRHAYTILLDVEQNKQEKKSVKLDLEERFSI